MRTIAGDECKELGADYVKVYAMPINGGKLGDFIGSSGLRLNGFDGDHNPRLEFFGEEFDEVTDPEQYKIVAANPGTHTLRLKRKIWKLNMNQREQILAGNIPASQGGGLIDHAAEFLGENVVFTMPTKKEGGKFPIPVLVADFYIGMFPVTDYGSGFWKNHPAGKQPGSVPVGLDAVRFC